MRVLTVKPETSLSAVEAALARVRAPRIALSFTPCHPASLADERDWHALAVTCDRLGKEVLIVGGDDTLRALAVAAGFAVVTTLDDDQPRSALEDPEIPGPLAWEEAEVAFGVRRGRATLPLRMDEEPGIGAADEPPAFVRHLLEHGGAYAGPRDDDPTHERRRPRVTRPLEPLDDDELLLIENESHEDLLTRVIRHTGGVPSSPRRLAPRDDESQTGRGAP